MNISFFPEPNIILQIGSISLYLYGAMYVLGTIICILWIWKISKISFEVVSDLGAITLLGGVLGGRIFYIFAYNFSYYIENPLEIFAVWNGGMSIHGGLIGGIFAFIWFCKKNKLDWKTLADFLIPALAISLMLGRFGNFINGELVGRITTLPWGVNFGDGMIRHPSQIYSMIKDFIIAIIFLFIILKYKNNKFWGNGQLFFAFIATYGVMRFFVEFFRTPDPQIGLLWLGLSIGQILSIIVIIIGITGVIQLQKEKI